MKLSSAPRSPAPCCSRQRNRRRSLPQIQGGIGSSYDKLTKESLQKTIHSFQEALALWQAAEIDARIQNQVLDEAQHAGRLDRQGVRRINLDGRALVRGFFTRCSSTSSPSTWCCSSSGPCGRCSRRIFAGLVVAGGLVAGKRLDGWTGAFLVTTVATSVTRFGFPFVEFLPSHAVGIISLVVLAAVIVARYLKHLAGAWRGIYGVGTVLALYLNVFVLVAQLFPEASGPDCRRADPEGAAIFGDAAHRAGAVRLAGAGRGEGFPRREGRCDAAGSVAAGVCHPPRRHRKRERSTRWQTVSGAISPPWPAGSTELGCSASANDEKTTEQQNDLRKKGVGIMQRAREEWGVE